MRESLGPFAMGSNVSGGRGVYTGAQQGVNARREAEDKTWAG